MQKEMPLISAEEVSQLMKAQTTSVLLSVMQHPVDPTLTPVIPECLIPHTQIVDIDAEFSDAMNPLPHSLPVDKHLIDLFKKINLPVSQPLLVYDLYGIFCAPRVWWMALLLGFEQVSVLNGGNPIWSKNAKTLDKQLPSLINGRLRPQDIPTGINHKLIATKEQVYASLHDPEVQIVDARSSDRFRGRIAEPRQGLRRGHIPGASNLPFTLLLDEHKCMQHERIQTCFNALGLDPAKRQIFYCGSGVTACILALAASVLGYENWSVYDGSWSEWGADPSLPIE